VTLRAFFTNSWWCDFYACAQLLLERHGNRCKQVNTEIVATDCIAAIVLARWRQCAPIIKHGSSDPHESASPYGISIGSSVFAGLAVVTNSLHRLRHCVCVNQRWQWVSGSRVTGQVGQQIWVNHVGHGSVLVTRWPMIKLTRFQEQAILWQWRCLIWRALPLSGPDWKLH